MVNAAKNMDLWPCKLSVQLTLIQSTKITNNPKIEHGCVGLMQMVRGISHSRC